MNKEDARAVKPNLKKRLSDGECVIGIGLWTSTPEVIEWIAPGMDWLWWECQHTHFDWQTTMYGVRASHLAGLPVLVRTWTHEGGVIERLLDTGADGILVPMVDTVEQAEEIVAHCYYPPIGNRSYGAIPPVCINPDTNELNRRTIVVMTLETPLAIKNAEAIARIPGVDALMVGAADLSMRKGKPCGTYEMHEHVSGEMKRVLEVCRKTGKAAMIITVSPEDLKARVAEGYRFICAGMDVDWLEFSYRSMQKAFREVSGGVRSNPKTEGH